MCIRDSRVAVGQLDRLHLRAAAAHRAVRAEVGADDGGVVGRRRARERAGGGDGVHLQGLRGGAGAKAAGCSRRVTRNL